jgi:hypothetical protein
MKLIQFLSKDNKRAVGIVKGGKIFALHTVQTVYDLFFYAEEKAWSIEKAAEQLDSGNEENYDVIIDQKRLLVPLDHPDPYHCWVTGTGLTHIGGAASRNAMHEKTGKETEDDLTDSMKMFRFGLENGKFINHKPASQPEWFYKGNGLIVTNPGGELVSPEYAMDGGEEPEIAGLYIINKQGVQKRIGFALANEFSDHKMEQINYLYLAHSKLRTCSYGPEILLGNLPDHIEGQSKVIRNNHTVWQKNFLTGETNMTHNIANLEHHHFKYDLFRQPGDVHVHFLGTAVLSYSDGFETKNGDIFEISADCFELPLRNQLTTQKKTATLR